MPTATPSFATTAAQRQRELLNSGVERVLLHLRAGRPTTALEFLTQSVERQARCEGLTIQLPRPIPVPAPSPQEPDQEAA